MNLMFLNYGCTSRFMVTVEQVEISKEFDLYIIDRRAKELKIQTDRWQILKSYSLNVVYFDDCQIS